MTIEIEIIQYILEKIRNCLCKNYIENIANIANIENNLNIFVSNVICQRTKLFVYGRVCVCVRT